MQRHERAVLLVVAGGEFRATGGDPLLRALHSGFTGCGPSGAGHRHQSGTGSGEASTVTSRVVWGDRPRPKPDSVAPAGAVL